MKKADNYQAEQLPCARHQGQTTTRSDDTTKEQEVTYDNRTQDNEIYNAPLGPTLRELTIRPGLCENAQYPELRPHHKTELQFFIACSLLNLDGSHWIQSGLHGNNISLRAAQRTSDFLKFWEPYTTCILSVQSTEEDENLAILSFGLLLMETEASKIASQIETGGNYNYNAETLRCILKRTLKEAEGVGVSYKNIVDACLHFSTHLETFYDPLLDGYDRRTKRAGAIYKYIVAPLFRLCIQKFQNVGSSLPRTNGFPPSALSYSASKKDTSSFRRPVTNAAFFDGSGPASSTRHYM